MSFSPWFQLHLFSQFIWAFFYMVSVGAAILVAISLLLAFFLREKNDANI